MSHFIGIDVGTGSVRAAVVSDDGRFKSSVSAEIKLWNPTTDHYEQSSDDIWDKCCEVVRVAIKKSGISQNDIKGIGFDATCSLVALDEADKPVTISTTGNDNQNIILWMDHRAMNEAEFINSTKHQVLQFVGGKISPEMECSKLLWIKKHLPSSWKRGSKFLDLADFMTYRATGVDSRSLCTVVCKWTFQGHKHTRDNSGWDDSFFEQIGLGDVKQRGYRAFGGNNIENMGTPIGSGLIARAAQELGLPVGTPVSIGIIDAHAGGLGLLGASLQGEEVTHELLEQRLALISGTSTCHMAVSREAKYIPGIWGPYFSAMIPNMWLTEGGQSATGALIDHIINSHSASQKLKEFAAEEGKNVFDVLNEEVERQWNESGLPFRAKLTKDLHVFPDFHGNRSPVADPSLKGMISGLNMESNLHQLALLYLSTLQAIAYGTRHIIESMNAKGYKINTIFMTGGGVKNRLYIQEIADCTGCTVVIPREPEAVLLGAAILGAVASGRFPSIVDAMKQMNRVGSVVQPYTIDHSPPTKRLKLDDTWSSAIRNYHQAKYQVFLKMLEDQMTYRRFMKD